MDINSVSSAGQTFLNHRKTVAKSNSNGFLSQLEATRTAPQPQDTVSLSTLSYEQRLGELRKIHENTDYSNMSDRDIARLIEKRFDDAFPNYGAIMGGLYLCAGENSIYEKVRAESNRQVVEANGGEKLDYPHDKEGEQEWRRYIRGYDGLSDDEIMEKLNEKYSGGTLADRCGMIWEMWCLDLDGGGGYDALRQIQNEMVQRTEAQYGHLHRDNPLRVNAMIGVGENTTISWSQLIKNCYDDRKDNWTYRSEELKQQILQELKGNLEQLLDRLGLPQIDLK